MMEHIIKGICTRRRLGLQTDLDKKIDVQLREAYDNEELDRVYKVKYYCADGDVIITTTWR